MKQHLEIEYKTLCTSEQFDAMNASMNFNEARKQTNVYFDTESKTLLSQHMMCRIRTIDDTYEFTLKVPQETGVQEYEIGVDTLGLDYPPIITILSEFGVDAQDCAIIATSTTFRSTYHDLFGTWCLDENHFDNHVDYEIEYELDAFHKDAYEHYCNVLEAHGIQHNKAKPKFIRALYSGQ